MGQCPHYKGNLVCGATNQTISSYTRDNTCYKSYDQCVHYKGSSSSGCYLTSACMQAQQERFDDNCYELTELRRFRDEYVIVNHPDEVSHYYEVAPQVVSKIDEHKDSANIYQLMYENMVLPAVRLFRSGEVEEAYKVYKAYSDCLESRFVLIDNRLITRNQILEKDSKGGE